MPKQRSKVSLAAAEFQRRMRVNEEQEMEMEALQSILSADIHLDAAIDTDHDFPRAFLVTIMPHPGLDEPNYAKIELTVRYGN
jgi:hypothetical protein